MSEVTEQEEPEEEVPVDVHPKPVALPKKPVAAPKKPVAVPKKPVFEAVPKKPEPMPVLKKHKVPSAEGTYISDLASLFLYSLNTFFSCFTDVCDALGVRVICHLKFHVSFFECITLFSLCIFHYCLYMYLNVHKNESLLISLKHLMYQRELFQKRKCLLQHLKSQK